MTAELHSFCKALDHGPLLRELAVAWTVKGRVAVRRLFGEATDEVGKKKKVSRLVETSTASSVRVQTHHHELRYHVL